MPEDTTDNVLLQADAAGNTYTARTSVLGGGHVPHVMPADPASGAAIKAASQADVQEVRNRLPAGGAATEATLSTLVSAMATLIAQQATEATLAAINAKLPAALSGGKLLVTDPSALPLPSGAATEATLATLATQSGQATAVTKLTSLDSKIPAATAASLAGTEAGIPTRQVPATIRRCSFAQVGAGLVTPDLVQVGAVGSGMGVSQAGGSLVVTTGTTTNAEWLARTSYTIRGAHAFRASVVLSQRIANQSFAIELADLQGDNLAYVINSATSVTVTFPAGTNPFTAANVGQSVNLSAMTVANSVPGRWPIASVAGDTVTFTVAGFPASGSGTLTMWGWNYHRVLFDGATATSAKYDAQRNGWASGDTTITINTTASPGTVMHVQSDGSDASCADALRASNTGYNFTTRGSRLENLPDQTTQLYLWIRAWNGTAAPASTTTFTVGFIATEDLENIKVALSGATRNGAGNALPIAVQGTPAVTVSSTTSLTPGTAAANLGKAEDAAAASGDTGVMTLWVRRDALTTSASATGDYNEAACDRFGAALVRSFEKQSRSYRAAANVTPAATPSDVADLFGNATTTVVVTAITVTGVQTTGGTPEIQLVKRSTANSAGTRVAMTAVPLDAGDAAASSIPGTYTANPTPGTAVGAVDRRYVPIPAAASPGVGGVRFEFGDKGKGLLLSGTAQGIAVNLNGVTLTGGVLDILFEWYEY